MSKQSFYNWVKQESIIKETIKKGRESVLLKIEESFINNSCLPHTVQDKKIVKKDDGTTEKQILERTVQPKAGAQIFYLKINGLKNIEIKKTIS